MKTKILLTSAGSAGIATLLGIASVLVYGGTGEVLMSSIQTASKLYSIAVMFGLLGISTLFIGAVYPDGTSTVTTGVGGKGKRGN